MDCKTSLRILTLSILFYKTAKEILTSSADYYKK